MRAPSGERELREYRAKRDFRRTPEPGGERGARRAARAAGARRARFVVHEHHARRLHWDLRLEYEGALMSWAVPNGIPDDPRENRKAIHVEDHPLEYLDFEGEIPHGSYGAGRIAIWDRGTYDCEKREDGKLIVVFDGERLRGRYALFRAGAERDDWMIHRMDPSEHAREAMPAHVVPMLASLGRLPRDDRAWAFEVKWDGVRAIAYLRPGRVRIESRNLNDISARYPELRGLARQLGMRDAVLDGEIVAFDEHGTPSFERLAQRMHVSSQSAVRRLAESVPVTYAIFDVLYLDGRATMDLPYRERRELLEGLGLDGAAWQTPAYRAGGGRELLAATVAHGLEGLVAKRLDSRYRPGERGAEWLKLKNVNRQEFVIGGWLPGKGRRAEQLGALLVGYHEDDGEGGRCLRYAGRVGTGFDEHELQRLGTLLAKRARRTSPFANRGVQPPRESRFVAPQLVAEIEFANWTRQRILRHSAYKGLREDKPAADVEVELPLAPARAVQPATASSARGERSATAASSAGGERSVTAASSASAARSSTVASANGAQPYEVLRETKHHTTVAVDGRELRLSNRDKLLYPQAQFTKGELIDYYAAVAPVLLPHLARRPLTLKRYPDGVEGQHFYEKRCPSHRPEWVRTAPVWSERQREPIEYCVVEDRPTLMWAANLASIELHTSLSLAPDLDVPTALVFDLDPGAPAGLRECCRVALWIERMLGALGLQTFAKTSGVKGLQVYAPLDGGCTYAQTKPFAHAVARLLEHEHRELVLSRMTRDLRAGKVLIDWSQNDPHKTTVSVYSLRACERPTISTPLDWEQIEHGSRRRREPQLSLEPTALLKLVERRGDLFAPVLDVSQSLPRLAGGAVNPPPDRI